jgi:hypothetical protein
VFVIGIGGGGDGCVRWTNRREDRMREREGFG